MMRLPCLFTVAFLLAGHALAEGDGAKGEKDFAKCKTCHSIVDGANVIQRGGKVGPNLFGVVGRRAGGDPDYSYGPGMREAAAKGLVWDEDKIAAYVTDPGGFLQTFTGDPRARAKMTFRLKDGSNVAAYLAGLTPAAGDPAPPTPGN